MKDKNDNLGKFLKDKFAEDNASSDGWDVPNPKVWENAQLHIPDYPIKEKKDRKGIIIIILLLLVGAYISWSLLKINSLEKELNIQKIQFAEIEKDNNNLKNDFILENNKLTQAIDELNNTNNTLKQDVSNYANITKKIQSLKNKSTKTLQEKKSLIVLNNNLENKLSSQSSYILSLKNDKKILQNKLNNRDVIYANHSTDNNNNTINQKEERSKHLNIPRINPYEWITEKNINTEENINRIIIPKTSKNRRFEVGYSYALSSANSGYKKDFKDFEITSDGYEKSKTLIHSHGINLGFSPKKNNWFIQTGFNTASAQISQQSKSSIIYDKSNEYNNIQGDKVNDIEVNARTAFGENKSLLSIKIPEGSNIETGDLLYFDTKESQQERRYNIPLGVAYFHGKKKLKWLIKGGAEWNKVTSKNYNINADVYSNESIFPLDKIEISKNGSSSSQFMAAYAGIGADYQINPRWHARTELVYHYNFINNKSTDFSTSDLITRDFRLGINYRF